MAHLKVWTVPLILLIPSSIFLSFPPEIELDIFILTLQYTNHYTSVRAHKPSFLGRMTNGEVSEHVLNLMMLEVPLPE